MGVLVNDVIANGAKGYYGYGGYYRYGYGYGQNNGYYLEESGSIKRRLTNLFK
jgi:hypothetical protein